VGDETIDYQTMHEVSGSLASGLARHGVEPGDRIAFLCDNRRELVTLLFAAWRLGAINVPLNVFLRGRGLQHQLCDSGATTVVVDEAGLATLGPVMEQAAAVRRLILVETGSEPSDGEIEVVGYKDLLVAEAYPLDDREPDSPSMLMYTSGTTGAPKACILHDRYLCHIGRQFSAVFDARDGDVVFSSAPLYHVGGFIPLMWALARGLTVAMEPQFVASTFLDRARELGATQAVGVGFMAAALLNRPPSETDRHHSLRSVMFNPMSDADRARFEARFGVENLEGYGQTECTLLSANGAGTVRRSGAGRVVPWIDLRIVDEDDEDLPAGQVGEIAIRPLLPAAMYSGYWGQPDATLAAWRNLWHHSGDLGRLDDDGFLTFIDRKHDGIRRRGENISSLEVEQVLGAHPKVADVAVYPVRVEGEVDYAVKASVVLEAGADLQPSEFAEYAGRQLAYFMVPRFVEVVKALPRNASGRVMKFELRRQPFGPDVWDLDRLGLGATRPRRGDIGK
jgi:crotonobetaine/carnitine-CoA ligase